MGSTTNRKAISSSSSVRTVTSSHGPHMTCLVYRGNLPSTSFISDLDPSRSSSHFGVFQKRRAIGDEIAKLLAAGFIKEVFYRDWLANPVLVPKKNGTWHMCIDYTCLDKACPKDPFAFPRIDQVIDSTAGCQLL